MVSVFVMFCLLHANPVVYFTISSFPVIVFVCICDCIFITLSYFIIKWVFSILLREDYIPCGHRAKVGFRRDLPVWLVLWISSLHLRPFCGPLSWGYNPATPTSRDEDTNIPDPSGMSYPLFPSVSICTQPTPWVVRYPWCGFVFCLTCMFFLYRCILRSCSFLLYRVCTYL